MEDDKKAAHVKVRRSVGMIVSVGCWVFFFASAATLSTCFSGPVDMCHVSCAMFIVPLSFAAVDATILTARRFL